MVDTIVDTTVYTFDQPIEISVKVGIEVDSKGQRKPSVEIKISHKLSLTEAAGGNLITILDLAVATALSRCKDTLNKAIEA